MLAPEFSMMEHPWDDRKRFLSREDGGWVLFALDRRRALCSCLHEVTVLCSL